MVVYLCVSEPRTVVDFTLLSSFPFPFHVPLQVVPGQQQEGLEAAWEEGRMHDVAQGVGLEGEWEAATAAAVSGWLVVLCWWMVRGYTYNPFFQPFFGIQRATHWPVCLVPMSMLMSRGRRWRRSWMRRGPGRLKGRRQHPEYGAWVGVDG